MDMLTIELKVGYSEHTIIDMFETNEKRHKYIDFIIQAASDMRADKKKYWWLITKRDYKVALITFPYSFFKKFIDQAVSPDLMLFFRFVNYRVSTGKKINAVTNTAVVMRLDSFLNYLKVLGFKKACQK